MTTGLPGNIHQQTEAVEYWFAEGCFITEWMNLDAEPGVSIARARVLPGTTTRWHRLRDVTERYVILAGSGLVEIEGLAPTKVAPGTTVIIAPGAAQRICNIGANDLVFMAVCTPRFVPACYEGLEEPAADPPQSE